MKKLSWVLSLPVLFLIFFSCSNKEFDEQEDQMTPTSSSISMNASDAPIESSWKLLYLGKKLIETNYRLDFSGDNTYSGVTKCNGRNSGTYSTELDMYETTDIVRVRPYGGAKRTKAYPTQLEEDFVYAYYLTIGLTVDNEGYLNQITSDNEPMVKYVREGNAPYEADDIRGTWRLYSVKEQNVNFTFRLDIPNYNDTIWVEGIIPPNRFAGRFDVGYPGGNNPTLYRLRMNPNSYIGSICDDETREYLQLLRDADGYSINGSILYLYKFGEIIATFRI